jgi:hypothetical protein
MRAPGRSRRLGDRFRALGLHRAKGSRAAGREDADQIDGDVGSAHRRLTEAG